MVSKRKIKFSSTLIIQDLSESDINVSQIIAFLMISSVQVVKIGSKTTVKNRSLRLQIIECEEVALGNEKIDLVDSFIYLA